MDERQIEQGYARFHRDLNRVLREKNVKTFKAFIASHPMQAGRLSRCLGLSDELTEIEMLKAIVLRSALKDMHPQAISRLTELGITPPRPRAKRNRRLQRGKERKL
ncbi:MAG: hypothetical protein B5M55_03705 [Desulfococcus sp. 4484_242]|nr:MAG: hypothetical protein B5M55_03705 [Desulfococcus sp. 4484_242]